MKINVCFISDDYYAMPTCVTISSIKNNRIESNEYDIYIISKEISQEKQKKFLQLQEDNFKITIINVGNEYDFSKYKIAGISANSTAIYKFLIPDILKKIDKVLYLDGDIIVKCDLGEIFSIDLEDKLVGAVRDYLAIEGINNIKYFNSGVILMNLKEMRKKEISKELLSYRENGFNHYMDQDAFNYVFKDKVKYLYFEFNTPVHFIEEMTIYDYAECKTKIKQYYNLKNNFESIEDIFYNAKIIHYTSSKPWKFLDIMGSELWFYYYNISPYKEEILYRKSRIKNLYQTSKSLRLAVFIRKICKKINIKNNKELEFKNFLKKFVE